MVLGAYLTRSYGIQVILLHISMSSTYFSCQIGLPKAQDRMANFE